jgi:hypothetical protein
MKWKDLSLKERKQIYDSVRVNNPDATYFDIKEQFDSIPEYEDGKDNSVAAVYSLPEVNVYPQNRFGDIARSQGYETAKNWQAVKNATTAGINEFANDPRTQFVLAALPIPSGVEGLSDVMKIMKPASKSKQLFYHGSPVNFDKFDPQFIGSAEGGSKAMKGINLWHGSPKSAPKFANIKSPDAPIHLGVSSKPLGGELNPTVYNVIGENLNLYKSESKRIKGLLQSNLEALGYDGIQTPVQTTVFPGAVDRLKIIKKQSIPEFIKAHPEVDKWTQWTTNEELRNLVESNIPAYEDGKGKTINKADLPPEYRTGTPEYFERQRKISGAVNTVQPEAYITPAGYIKDAVNFIEDLGKGDYAGAAMDAVLNLIPWGVGKGIKKLKSRVGRMVEGTEIDGASVHSFAPTQTKKKTKKKTEEDYDSEFSEVLRKDRNSKKYQQEISRTIEQAIFPDERTRELVENVDKTYGTNYKRAYSNIAYKDMTKRGSYVKWGDTDKDGYGQINIKNIKDNVLPTDINDYNIILDNNIYMPGTANHELGHVADGLAGSRKIQDFDSGKEYITNTYLNYLANSNNTYSSAELRKMGLFDAAGSRSYLLNPTEAKSHMLTLKRSLKDSGKITNWSTPVDENMILEYMRNPTSNKMVKNQYDLYRNKNEYIDRLNKLIPMEILMPLGGAGFVGHELNKE